MYRDPSEFRERFKAYKDGKSVREIYGLPGYAEGTVGTDPELDMIKKFEQWRDKTYLDSKNIPTIGWGFTDTSLVSKGKMSREEGDRYLLKIGNDAKKYLRNKLGSRIWDNLDTATKAALLSYHHNYPAGFGDNTRFMKHWRAGRYNEAVSEIDAGMNDPTSPGLKPRRLEEQATIRKDSFLFPKIRPLKPANALILKSDATKVAPIPTIQQQAIDYSDRRNAVVAEAERAMWAHNVMEDMRGTYQVPIWESHSLPALEPIELDVTPFKYNNGKLPGYLDGLTPEQKRIQDLIILNQGTIQQGHRWSPLSDYANSTWRDYNKSFAQLFIQGGLGNAARGLRLLFESWNNVARGVGDLTDYASIVLDVLGGAGGKVIKGSAKEAAKTTKNATKTAIKPTKTSIKKNLNPNNLGEYHAEHPEEVTPITDSKELKQTVDFVNRHIAPLYKKKNKVLIGLNPEDINLGYADFGNVDLAAYAGPNNRVVLNKKITNDSRYISDVLDHEVAGHIVDNNWPLTPSLMSEVLLAIPFDLLFLKDNEFFPAGAEANAMRRLFLSLISKDNGNVVGSALNKLYKNMPRALKKRYWSLIGYSDKTNIDWDNPTLFDKVVTSIPAVTAFAIPTTYIGIDTDRNLLAYNNGKLPEYRNGKIRIKPANRGKFNATKKRTGKTTEELTHSKNPLTRKRAIFALNAKKWNHK